MPCQAQQLLQQLKQGGDFAQLADRYSADRDAYPGGLHEVALPKDQPDWRPPVLKGLAAGQTSGVLQVGESLAIVQFMGIREPHVISFADAQGAISQALLEHKRADAQAAWVATLKRKARIVYLPGAEELGLHAAATKP